MTGTQTLKAHLEGVPLGNIQDTAELEGLLAAAWDEFTGDDGGMKSDKLFNRMESASWNQPVLSFVIERHGGTVMGSTRAELQHWDVNVETGILTLEKTGHRQLSPMGPRISIKAIADEIADAVIGGEDDQRFHRRGNELDINTSTIFPKKSGFNRTVESRRQRVCEHIAKRLAEHGWEKVGWNRFRKCGSKNE